ncbi:MAG: type II toxin-antitoxin system RelE/ParE family toxin [Janthinobacterium lividum]
MDEIVKPLEFVGSARKDLKEMPNAVRRTFGTALYLAQSGEKAAKAKPLKGFRGAGVLEIVEDYDTDTYRAVYTVRFAEAVYVLHIFQKKSRSGIATSSRDLELIKTRLRDAEDMYAKRNTGR